MTLECTAARDRPGKTEPPASAQSVFCSSSQPPQDCCEEMNPDRLKNCVTPPAQYPQPVALNKSLHSRGGEGGGDGLPPSAINRGASLQHVPKILSNNVWIQAVPCPGHKILSRTLLASLLNWDSSTNPLCEGRRKRTSVKLVGGLP